MSFALRRKGSESRCAAIRASAAQASHRRKRAHGLRPKGAARAAAAAGASIAAVGPPCASGSRCKGDAASATEALLSGRALIVRAATLVAAAAPCIAAATDSPSFVRQALAVACSAMAFDAAVVATAALPAILLLFGGRAWWPLATPKTDEERDLECTLALEETARARARRAAELAATSNALSAEPV